MPVQLIIMEAKCHQDTYPHTLNHVNYYYFCGNAGKYVASDVKDLGDHNYRVALTIEVREGSHSEIIQRSLRDHLEITQRSIRDNLEITQSQRSFRDHSENTQGSCIEQAVHPSPI